MDDIVARAMNKWPNVPNVFGWLRLDRRGNWLVKTRSGAFDRIGNSAVTDFISRNYSADEHGRWFFQNGPQRVFVTLDYTPWVYRLSDGSASIEAQDGRPVDHIEALYLDEAGSLLLKCEPGVGLVNDRDLGAFLEILVRENPVIGDGGALLTLAVLKNPPFLLCFGRRISLGQLQSRKVAGLFGFDPAPSPPPGEPDC